MKCYCLNCKEEKVMEYLIKHITKDIIKVEGRCCTCRSYLCKIFYR